VIEIIIAAAAATAVPERWPLWPEFWSKYEAHAAVYQAEKRKKDAAKRLESERRGDGGRRNPDADRVTK
jgi:hypothetical protein